MNMRVRCTEHWQVKCPSYFGVTCDPRWETFEGFRDNPPRVADGHEFEPGMELARVGDVGPYSPENARWRTKAENIREMLEHSRMIRLPDGRFGVDVARENGIPGGTWNHRLHLGWDPTKAATAPVGARMGKEPRLTSDGRPARAVAITNGIDPSVMSRRLSKGWDVDRACTEPCPPNNRWKNRHLGDLIGPTDD
jgi:hypothetical protein